MRMWIVRLALRRPYTFVVVALLIAVLGIVSIVTMQTDIFPAINIPVVSVIWIYGGLSPTEMQDSGPLQLVRMPTAPGRPPANTDPENNPAAMDH
jgi:Cu/Ag efflux pump CusA